MRNLYSGISMTIWLFATITLINRCGSMVLIFLPLYLTQKLNFSVIFTGQILSLYGLGEIAGSYLGGILSDRIGYLRVQTASLFIVGTLYLFLQALHSGIIFMSMLFLLGLLTASIRPAVSANIANFSTSKTMARAYALNYQAMNLGFCLGSLLGGLLITASYSWLFIIDGLMSITAAIALWLFFRSKMVKPMPKHNSLFIQNELPLLSNKPFLILLGLVLLIGMSFFLISNIYPLYLKENYFIPEAKIGIIIALNGLLIILFQMQLTSWLRPFSSLRTIGIGGLIVTMGYFILPFYKGVYYAALSMVLITLGEMIAVPIIYDYVARMAPPHRIGKYQGLVSCVLMSLPLVITPNLASYMYVTLGANVLWFSVGIIGLVIYIGCESLNKLESR